MTIYRYTQDDIVALPKTSFAEVQISERADLQRLLQDRIEILNPDSLVASPDLLVISEEFSEWDDSKRRIDLLAIDREANVVVVELKRSEDGGHMELQSLRYAAMVSVMTFTDAEKTFTTYLAKRGDNRAARDVILNFLGWDEPCEDDFGNKVRIVLASAEFSKEITTSVLWLRSQGLDITCVRIKPYGTKDELFLDVQTIIPLPEAEAYQIKIRQKQAAQGVSAASAWNGQDFYVSLGEYDDANWDDCLKYGFVTGSGGRWYTRTLDHLFVGSRVFVLIPKRGYVGVGIVTEKNQTIDNFMVQDGTETKRLLDAPLSAKDMSQNTGDPDMCSNVVRVEWIKTVAREDAFWEPGLFAITHTACKLKDQNTIDRVCQNFGIDSTTGK
ncbi:hypothetical protein RISK_002346 [Rhodopirellula islandica]|uniref:Uncharacterized protein n=1 Tax=Rhodopirellula islandica TaxID=595434 RepID=A0A0J1EJL9_RHOIS|nr:hypothetical protein [Rhodopirellula islandica]KLU05714.1 hypothetical protein RISK_002346 [Rhodopirellula islandica]